MIYGDKKDFERAQNSITEALKNGKTETEALEAGLKTILDGINPDQTKKAKFVVCMDSSYVRDSQMFDTSDLSEDEFGEIEMHAEENENLWHDMEPTPFIAVIDAETEEDACSIAAERYRYDKRCLFAEKTI